MKGNKHHRIVKKFSELSLDDLYKIIQLRIDVFGDVIGYIRILDKGVSYKEIAIGRVIIKESYRKYKLGHQLMQDGIDYIRSLGETEIRISAQEHLRKFYERLGFEKVGEMYLEDDIPHIQMFKI